MFTASKEVSADQLGIYFIRGDNVSIIAEVDMQLEENIDYSKIKAAPIKPML